MKIFWAIVLAQAVFLLGWAGYHEAVRQRAPVILLKGRPVDPQDLLRGDYMILRYDISSVKLPSGTNAGGEVWVLLEKKGAHHEVVEAAREPLVAKSGQVLVRGELGHTWSDGAPGSDLRYGIEKYFVPEGRGTPRFQSMEMEVSVSPAHRLYLKRVLLDGKTFP